MNDNSSTVIPVKTGIQLFQNILDPRFREDDVVVIFLPVFCIIYYLNSRCYIKSET